ncbi:plasmid stabilization protein ParE [Thermococcus celericrescens]|uniref:Plasmid stabilization protein ParE n=1 Tax=Thermococcus celericrescens TaxID=227598 RepID=A0A100XWI3_9EURY|nr:type II toxin-antitoxin system RelE/ParE family toxin [Thermococcus celericrescens]KUH32462.1 plasmid stabilization protein ParE [Thermococcus celericrescens]
MYDVIVDRDVVKKAKRYLKPAQRRKLAEFIDALKTNPYPKPPYDLKPVRGEKTKKTNTYRLRIGDYRVFYTVYWDEKVIVVTDIKPRETAYR